MSNIVIVGFAAEGTTDHRFLESVIRRTFEDVAFECNSLPEIYSVQHIPTKKSNFVDKTEQAARDANSFGVMVLCVHTDADHRTDKQAFDERILPAFRSVENSAEDICKNLVPIVPIQMTEAWMLADPELIINNIGTNKNINDLKLNRSPEAVSDPKKLIKEAIQLAFQDQTQRKRKRSLEISELYLPLGQAINLDKLEKLSSYQKFKEAVREAYRKLGYLH